MDREEKWYVIHTYSGYENKVKSHLEKLIENGRMENRLLDVKVPTEIVTEIKEQTEKQTEKKLFPGYVLVKLSVLGENNNYKIDDDVWYIIRNTRGVTGFVGPESKPVALSSEEVERIGIEKKSISVTYEIGDIVNIIDGPLKDFSGKVVSIDKENNKVNVKISMFGRETEAELELAQIESAV
ncbi:MAG: transcription termination/antitermination protein NusG [Clostridia bacterium]|nr:transcription termination/antitermination protein NusG [Clostridia bacterium]